MYSPCRKILVLLAATLLLAGCHKTEDSRPWGGVVSHHLLVGNHIDDFFANIKEEREVETFFLICPTHYGLSVQPWSVADCSWRIGSDDYVHTDLEKAQRVLDSLNVPFDPQVFPVEHGASALMPYIKKYFPEATVVVAAVNGEPPVNSQYNQALADAVLPFFSENKKDKNFLLVSSDFSHHVNEEKTRERDSRSEIFLSKADPDKWVFCNCDNRPGMYLLSRIMTEKTESRILCHTNSYEFTGEGEDDITSYFFVLFYR